MSFQLKIFDVDRTGNIGRIATPTTLTKSDCLICSSDQFDISDKKLANDAANISSGAVFFGEIVFGETPFGPKAKQVERIT